VLLSELLSEGGAARGAVEISGLTADSRAVRPGYLFAALRGSRTDGARFVADALARGAAAVLADREAHLTLPDPAVPLVEAANARRCLAQIAARFYGAQPRVVAAVTGTSGKTSVAAFTCRIWTRLGMRAASFGTLGVVAPGISGEGSEGISRPLAHTTPDPVTLHRELAALAEAGVDHLALEASSHGLDQCRLDAVRVTAAAFTNLGHDHLDYHPDRDAYLAAKLRLFDTVLAPGATAVLNFDDPASETVAAACRARGVEVVGYGRGDSCAYRIAALAPITGGQRLDLEIEGRRHEVALPLAGVFQAENAVCALALAVACGADPASARAALADLEGVPGRLQRVAVHPSGAPVYVDYSHKPDALEAVLTALRPATRGRLVVVFGCGGDRDRDKRPVMGEIAARHADCVIVTDDNPRGEDPAAIRRAVLAGCAQAREIGDRGEAIAAAVAMLGVDDALVIAGKGHERGQIVGDRVIPFDDAEVARAAVAAVATRDGGGAP